jgi:hypothetical protein
VWVSYEAQKTRPTAIEDAFGCRPWEHLGMWLTSYDIESGLGPIEVNLVAHASIGQRTDWAWATLEPPLRIDGKARDRVLLGARHQGGSVWSEPGRWPVHVYVCVPEVAAQSRNDFTREQVTIAYWGLLHESRERAEIDQY